MREIKFRGWNQKHKIMVEVALIDFLEKLVHLGSFEYSTEKVHLMQYTGLTDRNGKEIYEGDILTRKSLNTDKSYFYKVIWNQEECRYYAEGSMIIEPLPTVLERGYEHAGNVHEHPYLIEVIA